MRFCLLVCLLLLGSLRPRLSYAQAEPRPPGPIATLAVGSRPDTVRALHHYFEAHRRTGTRFLAAGLLTLPVALAITLGQVLTSFGANEKTGDVGGALVNLGLLGGVAPGLFLRLKFRRAKEQALVEGYEQGQGLRRKLRKKLETKYFD